MLTEIMNMSKQGPETWLRDLQHIGKEGETALSLVLKFEVSDFFVLVLLQMDKWALGVRYKKTENFPIHVIYETQFTAKLRSSVAADSHWIFAVTTIMTVQCCTCHWSQSVRCQLILCWISCATQR
jgi:hypothetical protein